MTDQTKDLLAQAEIAIANLLGCQDGGYPPSNSVFDHACKTIEAIRASATSAPAQTMQPLSDDELDLLCEKALFCKISKQQFARSIEAAHGITGTQDHTEQVLHMVGQPLTDEQIKAVVNNARKEWRDKSNVFNPWCDLGDDEKFLLVARAIESAVRAQGDGWLPIESIPKTSEDFLVLTELGTQKIMPGAYMHHMIRSSEIDKEPCYYTHWQPLPPPPNAQGYKP